MIKKYFLLTLSCILISQFSFANSSISSHNLMPDLNGSEYELLLKKNSETHFKKLTTSENKIDLILQFGQRNLTWLDHINSLRDHKLTFSNPENRRTFPINAPHIYNEESVINDYENLLASLPDVLKNVLLGNAPFTDDVPISVDEYLHYGLLIDYVYQGAARWKLMEPALSELQSLSSEDIRGYYSLSQMQNLEQKLTHLNSLSELEQNDIKSHLLGLCVNTENNLNICREKLSENEKSDSNNLFLFYNTYIDQSRETYNNYFKIPEFARRKDIVWSEKNPSVATIPFKDTKNDQLKNFLHNIELEWQWNDWKLILNYIDKSDVPYVKFVPGTTPHVNELGGNQIVMDANLSFGEWDNQWTIRHEFGHNLGFPDCYIEFYDESLKAIVNYQIDTLNLMCSRKGRLNESHFIEMKRNYFNTQ